MMTTNGSGFWNSWRCNTATRRYADAVLSGFISCCAFSTRGVLPPALLYIRRARKIFASSLHMNSRTTFSLTGSRTSQFALKCFSPASDLIYPNNFLRRRPCRAFRLGGREFAMANFCVSKTGSGSEGACGLIVHWENSCYVRCEKHLWPTAGRVQRKV
jgi:hypothetical protein